jgi:DNA adenine methylase
MAGRVQRNRDKSFLKWAGGKTRYAEALAALAPAEFGRYWEPFMGSAALFFELAPEPAHLSDANEELVISFQEVARDPHAVMRLLDGMTNSREYFEIVRARDPRTLTYAERAARVIYLNKTSFRGLWRVNKRGQYNVPYGAYERPYYNRETLLAAAASLARPGVNISHADYSDALRDAEPGDWVYLDPPYVPLGGYSDFKRYTSSQFHDEDHTRLARLMAEAGGRGVYVMLTNADKPEVRALYAGFAMTSFATRRDINLNARGRTSSDLIVTNYTEFRQQRLAV